VIPGYVKCPRCHAVLPGAGALRRGGVDPGGTSVEARSFPIVPVALGAAALALILLLVLGRGDKKPTAPAASAVEGTAEPTNAAVQATPGNDVPAPDPAAPATPAPSAPAAPPAPEPPGAVEPNPGAAAAELQRELGRQRLWSSVQASGERVDVRSGSCADPAMGPTIDAALAALRGAGLTRLRCLAQSGAVVFERDL
jgi:type IV secretory pathway VirB10-like protein